MKAMSDEELMAALKARPCLRERMVELLHIAHGGEGDLKLADDAEDRVLDGVRQLGLELLESWAQAQVQATEQDIRNSGRAHREGKKNSSGTASLATSLCTSRSTAATPKECAPSCAVPEFGRGGVRDACNA